MGVRVADVVLPTVTTSTVWLVTGQYADGNAAANWAFSVPAARSPMTSTEFGGEVTSRYRAAGALFAQPFCRVIACHVSGPPFTGSVATSGSVTWMGFPVAVPRTSFSRSTWPR